MLLQETILCATAPPTSNLDAGSISLHDVQTGVSLASFKQSNTGPNSIAVLESKNGQGGYILASQIDKSIMNVYNFQKDQLSLKIVLPEKLTCVTLDRRGSFCAGGTSSGRIYLWETASGILYNAWDAHYRQVNVLCFTNDGAGLISGSGDSGVSVWSVSRLLDDETQNGLPSPYCVLSDHTLPVTDIACGVGVFPNLRILTASEDHSVKVWDVSSKSLLTTFQFPQPIAHLAWDVTERLFFAASQGNTIYHCNLFQERVSKLGDMMLEAVGGSGVTDVIRIEGDEGKAGRNKKLITVQQPVTSICISLNCSVLIVGTAEGLIQLYDIPSHQLIRTITTHKGFLITHLQSMLKPPDLIGHINLQLLPSGSDSQEALPLKPISPFHRIKDPKGRDNHNISVLLPPQFRSHHDEISSYSQDEFLRDYAFFAQPVSEGEKGVMDPLSMKSEISDLHSEVARLREQLSKAKGLNDAMWSTVVQKLVGETEPSDAGVEDSEETSRAKKRGRSS